MKNPEVSVVIPAYNHEQYVGEAIQSVLDQTFQDFELIIINDGSTDNTEAEILKFKDERVRYFSQENRGLSATLNRGIELARGEYFNFLPSDDALFPEKLEVQLKFFEEDLRLGLVFAYPHLIDAEGREIKEDPAAQWAIVSYETKEEIFPALFERDFLSAPTALIKMECFEKVGRFDESLKTAQDYDMWMRILKYYDLRLIRRPLLRYRWHGANLTHQATPETELERAKVLLKAYKNLKTEDIFPSLHQRKDAVAYAEAYEKLATYMEKSGIPALLPISQIYRDRGRHLTEKKEDLFLFKREDGDEIEEGFHQGIFGGDSRRIHLLIETRSLDKGGLEEVIYGIATHLDPALFSTVVVCIEAGGFTADRIRKAGIPVEVLGREKEKEYIEILNQYRIDLVNTHYSFFGSAIAYQRGIPVISVLHNLYSWYLGGILDEFRVADLCVSKYIAVSKQVASFFEYRFNIERSRIEIIPDGIDLGRFTKDGTEKEVGRRALGFDVGDFVFLHVGAIAPAKMQNLLVAVMKEISKNHPKIKLISLGPELNKDYGSFIRMKIEESHLGQNVKLIGFVENPSSYYRVADAFVLPSLIEGWGISTLEAMYHGLPVILTKVGGAEELVENEDVGILIENCCDDLFQLSGTDLDYYSRLDFPKNAPELIEAMLNIYWNREKWKEKAKDGKRKVISHYTWDQVISGYEKKFIDLVLEGRKRREIRFSELRRHEQAQLVELEGRLKGYLKDREDQKKVIEDQSRIIQNQVELARLQQLRLEEQGRKLEDQIRERDHEIRHLIESRYQQLDKRIEYVLTRLSVKERIKGRLSKLLKAVHTLVPKKFREKYRSPYRRFFFDKIFPDKERLVTASPKSPDSAHYRDSVQYEFNPYDHVKLLKNLRVSTIDVDLDVNAIRTAFSFITTIKNESSNLIDFLMSVKEQTLKPNEIIIVDGGSTDHTIELIENYINQSALAIKLIKGSNLNIAQGRNIGIREAKNEFIVLSDAGCKLDRNFCKNLVGCFDVSKDVDLVGGIYRSLGVSQFAKYFICDWESVNWDEFLPSARSVAIKKSLWLRIGGFPEYLTLTGEDTLFDINYRRASAMWIFNRKSIIYWNPPRTEDEAYKLAFHYGKGDGESGIGDFRYYKLLSSYKKQGYIHEDPITAKYFEGFWEGRKKRVDIEIAKRDIRGVVLILSGVPISDSGGGQRGTQMALEFVRRNYKVVFVNIYPSFEKPLKIYFDIDYSLLELYHFNDFFVDEFYDRFQKILDKSLVVMEFPHPLFIPIIDRLREKSGKVQILYDYIDNWNSSLGGDWYSEEKEKEIINKSDILIASAKTLKEDLEKRSQRQVHLVPNAVNTYLFNDQTNYSRPQDLAYGKPVVIYTGAMWGDWFDWDLLDYCARYLRDFNFVLIGGGAPEERQNSILRMNDNVFFLGLKPQEELPAYLKYSSVCIVPFKEDNITKYVSPLKVYEYLAMLKPVVATHMEELRNAPYLFLSRDKDEFIGNIIEASAAALDKDRLYDFVLKNSWQVRVISISDIIGERFSVIDPHKENDLFASSFHDGISLRQGRFLEKIEGLPKFMGSTNPIKRWEGVFDLTENIEEHMRPVIGQYKEKVCHEEEFKYFQHFEGSTGIFVDVGSNVGQSAISFRVCNSTMRIIAFEPNPLAKPILEYLRTKVLSKFDYVNIGLSDKKGTTRLLLPVVDGTIVSPLASMDSSIFDREEDAERLKSLSKDKEFSLASVEVEVDLLDSFSLEPQIVKIDTEGHELQCLEGMRETIAKARPIFLIENHYYLSVTSFLRKLDYAPFAYDSRCNILRSCASDEKAERLNTFYVPEEKIKDLP